MTDLAVMPSLDLAHFATEASQVHSIAKAICNTSFVPAGLRGKPDETTAAILFGREIGLPPMVALQSIHVIEGRPSMSALAMRGKAQAAGVRFRFLEKNSTRVKYAALPPGESEWTEVLWTIDRAKQLGLTGKQNWVKQPEAMLVARATSELCRLVAANLFLGYAYSTEELRDGSQELTPVEPQQQPAPTRTVRREPVQAHVQTPTPEPEQWEQQPEPDAPQLEASPAITPGVRKALMAAFNTAGISARNDRLNRIMSVLGREVHSANQLTDSEAKTVIRDLEDPGDGDSQEWPETAAPGA